MARRLFTGAAALALVAGAVGCSGGAGAGTPAPGPADPPPPSPRAGPADAGTVTARTSGPDTTARGAVLGHGRDALTASQSLPCLIAPAIRTEAPHVLRRLAHPLSASETADLLGLADPVARALHLDDSGLAGLGRILDADPRSLPLLYGVEVRVATRALDLSAAALAPGSPAPGTAAFTTRCGDEVKVEEELGAQVFLLFKLDFASDAARATFARLVGDDVAVWDLHGRLAAADPALRGAYTLSIMAVQRNGDPALLGRASGDAADLLSCGAGAPARCASLVDAFVAYVTGDGPEDLPAQAAAAPGPLGDRFEPWSAVTTAAAPPRAVPAEVAAARAALAARLEDRVRVRERVHLILRFAWTAPAALVASATAAERGVESDLMLLAQALAACRDLAGPDDAEAIARCTEGATPAVLAARGYGGAPALGDL